MSPLGTDFAESWSAKLPLLFALGFCHACHFAMRLSSLLQADGQCAPLIERFRAEVEQLPFYCEIRDLSEAEVLTRVRRILNGQPECLTSDVGADLSRASMQERRKHILGEVALADN
jgi:hypothetical protein